MVRPTVHGVRMRLNLRVPVRLYQRVAAAAVARRIPLNDLACEALTDWCDRNAPVREDRPR